MSKEFNNLFRRVLVLGSSLIAAIAMIGGLVGFLVAGLAGLTSSLIGAGLTLVFGGWLVKVIGFVLVIGSLKGADFINGPVLFFTLVAAILGTLAVDSILVLKARITVFADNK